MEDQVLMRRALVVGQHFVKDDDGKEAIANLEAGAELSIVHDTKNEYDHYAASVRLGDVHIGYVSADISPVLCVMASNGYTVGAEVIELQINKQKNFMISVKAALTT